ncbi:phosphatidylserine/phosphatidylglycerophosphate/cardiolipin synthase family protein [Sorangium sp. So ce185]|uniref:phospholipase D-like domain-containing protein n=1 Tax=Sorangium sp. So ce185 TaxID=3133287 RepID=UPI003F60CA69
MLTFPGSRANSRTSHAVPDRGCALHATRLLPGMTVVLESLLDDIARARERIWISTYIYRNDLMGHRFADAFAAAVRRGVDVRLLYDALGSHATPAQFFEDMRARGIRARAYRPLGTVLRRGVVFPREHSRIVVIDGAGYVGGAAWADEWLPRDQGGDGWHEVCSRVVGPCVGDMARAFECRWMLANEADGRSFDYWTGGVYDDVEFITDAPRPPAIIYERHVERVRSARRRVWIENAYFCPPRGLERELIDAARRGIDVKIIVPRNSDLPAIRNASLARYRGWLENGLQIYEFLPSMLHSKFAVIDDDWATVGTFNVNPTSLRWVSEANLIVKQPGFVRDAANLFERDVDRSEEVCLNNLPRLGALARMRNALWSLGLDLLEPRYASGRGRGALPEPEREGGFLPAIGV